MSLRTCLAAAALGCAVTGAAQAELMGVSCTFTRVCNNFLACEDISYQLTVAPTQDGWVFRDDEGARPAIRLPETPGAGIPAFASEASYDSTLLLTVYSGGPAMLVEHFEEPGFWSYRGACEVMQ